MIKSTLNRFVLDKRVVSLSWGTQGTHVGVVLGVDDEAVLIAHITSCGLYDGYVIRPLVGLESITYGGEYENKIELLYTLRQQRHETICLNNNIYDDVLCYAHERELIVTAESNGEAITGFLEFWDDCVIRFRVLDQYAKENGCALIFKSAIDLLAVDTDYEQALALIYANTRG